MLTMEDYLNHEDEVRRLMSDLQNEEEESNEFIYSLEDFRRVGVLAKVYQLSDAVFVFSDKEQLCYHYAGMFGGWRLHKKTYCRTLDEAKNQAETWLRG